MKTRSAFFFDQRSEIPSKMTTYPTQSPLELGVRIGTVVFLDTETEYFNPMDAESKRRAKIRCVCMQTCAPGPDDGGHTVVHRNLLMSHADDPSVRDREDAAAFEVVAAELDAADLIVAHAGLDFDVLKIGDHAKRLMSASAERCDWWLIKTWDTMYPPRKRPPGTKCGLQMLAEAAGIEGKSGSALDAPKLWDKGMYAELLSYCEKDVTVLRELCVDREFVHPRNENATLNMALPISYVAGVQPPTSIDPWSGMSEKRAKARRPKVVKVLKPRAPKMKRTRVTKIGP